MADEADDLIEDDEEFAVDDLDEDLDDDGLVEDDLDDDGGLGDDLDDDDVVDDDDEDEDVLDKPAPAKGESEDEDEDEPDPDDVEADLDAILKDRIAASDDEDEDEEEEQGIVEPDGADGGGRIQPKRPGEFVCQSCFLVKHPSQLADEANQLCLDCV